MGSFGQWRWTPVAIAVVAFTLVVGGGLALTRASDDPGGTAATTTTPGEGVIEVVGADTTVAAVPDTATAASVVAANAVVTKVPITQTLSKGMFGTEVQVLQQRLKDLSFDPGPIDGAYGDYTVQAVWAFETLVLGTPLADVTGKVTPELWDRMQDAVTITPRRNNLSSTHVEIYLPEQALIVFKDNLPVLTAHISSGELEAPGDDFTKGAEWCDEVTISPGENGNEEGTEEIKDGRCGNAVTPGGTYRFYRKYAGNRQSALGGMYNPVYFNYGIAIHGALNVPDHPASHGCIRINMYLAKTFPDLIVNASGTEAKPRGDDVYVWNGVEDPEIYGPKTGRFDWVWQEWRDKNSTTTSTSTTSTTTPTTLPGETTTVPAATAPPPVTTTTSVPATTVAPTTLPPTTVAPTPAVTEAPVTVAAPVGP